MDSEAFLNDNFGESEEKTEPCKNFTCKIKLYWVRIFVCSLTFIGILCCKHFSPPYYTKINEFYSANFKNSDEKIDEMKNFTLDKLSSLHLKIKEKINRL